MGIFISLAICLIVQYLTSLVLYSLGASSLIVSIGIDLALAIVFTFINFRGQEKLRNPAFHSSIFINFAILSLISLLFGGYY